MHRSPVDQHARLLSAGTAAQLLGGTGLEIVQLKCLLYFPERLYRAMRGLEAALA